VGPAGIAGTNGLDGAVGAAGPAGIAGTNGLDGLDGEDGIDAPAAEPIVTAGTILQYYRGDKSWQTLTAASVNLGNVDNTSDLTKVISTPTQTALNLKANLTSPEFTGIPLSTTASLGTNSTQIATTAFVLANSNQQYSVSEGTEIVTNSTNGMSGSAMLLSPAVGNYLLQMNAQLTINPVSTIQAGSDLDDAYTALMNKSVTNSSHSVTYGGDTLVPGVYTNTGATTANGTLTLDGGGNLNSEFVFRSGGAFSTGAAFNLVLINGASPCHVYWVAEGAIALGAGTTIQGTFIANNVAITVGSLSQITGNLLSTAGAIGLDDTSISVQTSCTNAIENIAHFALYTKAGNLTNVGSSTITGDIATHVGTITGFSTATLNGTSYNSGISSSNVQFSFYQNGSIIPFSTRTLSANASLSSVINLQSVSLFTTGDNVNVRWTIDAGTLKLLAIVITLPD
jgi:hypothetical protein